MPSLQELIEAEARAEARRHHPLRLLAIFLAAFFALQYAWEMARGSAVEQLVIDRLTVQPAAWLIDQLWPEHGVAAQGHRLVAPHSRLNVLNGCEGLETLFLLIAAFLAHPLSWRARLAGIGLGVGLVFILNQARIVLLWQAWASDRALFGLLHGTVLPLALAAASLLFFLAFLSRQPARHGADRA